MKLRKRMGQELRAAEDTVADRISEYWEECWEPFDDELFDYYGADECLYDDSMYEVGLDEIGLAIIRDEYALPANESSCVDGACDCALADDYED